MGNGHVHTATITQQTSVTTINTTAASATVATTTHTITREEWEAMKKETADAKRKANEAHSQLEILRKQTTQSNPNSSQRLSFQVCKLK